MCLLCGRSWTVTPHFAKHSTNTPHSTPTTCCSYHKEKWAKPENLPKAMLFRKSDSIRYQSKVTLSKWSAEETLSIDSLTRSQLIPYVTKQPTCPLPTAVGQSHIQGTAVDTHRHKHSPGSRTNHITTPPLCHCVPTCVQRVKLLYIRRKCCCCYFVNMNSLLSITRWISTRHAMYV